MRPEHQILVTRRQAGVQGQDFRARQILAAQCLAQLPNIPLPGNEHQQVLPACPVQFGHRLEHPVDHVPAAAGILVQWAIANLHRIGAPGHGKDGRAVEMVGKALRIDGGRGDDEFQVGPARQQALEVTQQEIDVEAALVGLVDDQGVVSPQHPVPGQLGQQDAVRHDLDERIGAQLLGKSYLIAGYLAQRRAQFLGQTGGHGAGRQPARLGMADQAPHPASRFQAKLGNLGGLARAGGTADHHHRMRRDGGHQRLPRAADGQLGRIMQDRQSLATAFAGAEAGLDAPGQISRQRLPRSAPLLRRLHGLQLPAQGGLILAAAQGNPCVQRRGNITTHGKIRSCRSAA